MYSLEDVCSMFNVTRSTIKRWEDPKEGNDFPQRVALGLTKPGKRRTCRVGFPKIEVDTWAQTRMDKRKPPK